MTSRYILTVDVGTSSAKTSLWTESGRLVAHATSAYELQRAEPLWAEIDGDVWWRAVCKTIRTVLATSGVDPASIARWLGHANLTTTNKYAVMDIEMKRDVLSKIRPINHENDKLSWKRPDILAWLESL